MVKQIAQEVIGELIETARQTGQQAKKVVTGFKNDGNKDLVRDLYGADEKEVMSKEELEKLKRAEGQKSAERYKQVQKDIVTERKKKQSQPRKYEIGMAGFKEEKAKKPGGYFEKLKEEKEAKDKQLTLSQKQGQGTGEVSRGASG